jgi:TRAP-type mannitol/chloroaromatic compound transport system substrate-binding protein
MKSTKLFNFFAVGVFSLILLVSFSLISPVSAADKVFRWKIQSHWPASSSSYQASLVVVAEKLKKVTNGRLILQPYAAGSLVPAKEIFNAVKRGMIQGGTASPAYFRDQIQVAGIASGLPYSFKNVWEAAYFHQWMGFEQMLRDEALEHGIYYITDKVYPTEMVVSKPVTSLADIQGLKLRSSGVLQKFLSRLGAAASYLPGTELYPALASGVMDGAHWGAAQGAYSMKLYDVCKYHVLPSLNIAGTDSWLFNKRAVDKLPDDIKKVFFATMEAHFWARTNQYIFLEKKVLAKAVAEKGVKITRISDDEQKKITAIAMKMWDEEAKRGPKAAKALQMLKDYLKTLGHL